MAHSLAQAMSRGGNRPDSLARSVGQSGWASEPTGGVGNKCMGIIAFARGPLVGMRNVRPALPHTAQNSGTMTSMTAKVMTHSPAPNFK